MEDETLHRLQDSSVAAALSALAPGMDVDGQVAEDQLQLLAPDDTMAWIIGQNVAEPDRLVFEACRELALAGIRPRSRAVAAFLKDRHGSSPPKDEISPLLKRWRAAQWKSVEVRTAYQAYAALDAEQRIAFKLRAEIDDGMMSSAADDHATDAMPFEIRIQYRGGRVRSEFADRATTAWVKLQNLIDRRHPDIARIELSERTSQGQKTLKHWTPTLSNIATWK